MSETTYKDDDPLYLYVIWNDAVEDHMPAPIREGYVFSYWSTDADGSYCQEYAEDNMTFFAQWEKAEPVGVPGDVTNDGKVLTNDVVKLTQYVAGFITTLEPTAQLSAAGDTADIRVGSVAAQPGETVKVPVSIPVNPGIAGATFTFDYDKTALTLEKIERGEVMSGGTFTADQDLNVIQWYDVDKNKNTTDTGTLFTLTFQVKEDAALGVCPVTIALKDSEPANLSDIDSEAVAVSFTQGGVQVEQTAPDDGSLVVTKVADGLSIQIIPKSGLNYASGFCAAYDENGQMLCVEALNPDMETQTITLLCDTDEAKTVRAFFLDE